MTLKCESFVIETSDSWLLMRVYRLYFSESIILSTILFNNVMVLD